MTAAIFPVLLGTNKETETKQKRSPKGRHTKCVYRAAWQPREFVYYQRDRDRPRLFPLLSLSLSLSFIFSSIFGYSFPRNQFLKSGGITWKEGSFVRVTWNTFSSNRLKSLTVFLSFCISIAQFATFLVFLRFFPLSVIQIQTLAPMIHGISPLCVYFCPGQMFQSLSLFFCLCLSVSLSIFQFSPHYQSTLPSSFAPNPFNSFGSLLSRYR